MSRTWLWVLVLLALVGVILIGLSQIGAPTAVPASLPRSAAPTPRPGVVGVVRVVFDGDTFLVRIGVTDETVRVIGMDSPEVHRPDTPTECFATEATDAARRLLPRNAVVTLETDPTQGSRDRFGRMLAHVVLDDGTLFAERMIEGGFAVHYVYGRVPSIYAGRLSAAQRAARGSGAGLWSRSACGGDPHAPSAAPR